MVDLKATLSSCRSIQNIQNIPLINNDLIFIFILVIVEDVRHWGRRDYEFHGWKGHEVNHDLPVSYFCYLGLNEDKVAFKSTTICEIVIAECLEVRIHFYFNIISVNVLTFFYTFTISDEFVKHTTL